ncbi:MAG: ROK family protein [Bacteroidetes bacterium]|nr:ROK family protein [Bacteroidota bacterium]
MANSSYAIGIDLGGTTVKGALVDRKGNILETFKVPSFADEGPDAVLNQIKSTIKSLMSHARSKKIKGVGIAAAGIVDQKTGVVKSPPNFKNWGSVPVGSILTQSIGLPVLVENDANAAAIAEAKFGSGKNFPDFLFIIWGTGVGGGIILDGKIFHGPYGGAGEVGHISIDYNGVPCKCGSRGCVEAYIGQKYLSKRVAKELLKHPKSKLTKYIDGELEPLHISLAAEEGDEFSKKVLIEAGNYLGYAIAGVMNTMDLRVTIIGGGVSAVGKFVYKAIQTTVKNYVLTPLKDGIIVLPAALGNDAGVLGAAGLIL